MLRIYNKTGRLISVAGTRIPARESLDLLIPYDLNLRNMVRNKLISVKEIEESVVPVADPIIVERNEEVPTVNETTKEETSSPKRNTTKKKQTTTEEN